MHHLLIVQPYLPAYRVAFFAALIARLEHSSTRCVVAAPRPPHSLAQRQDEAQDLPWRTVLRGRRLDLGFTSLSYHGSRRLLEAADAVVVPASGTCVDTYLALAQRRRGLRVGVWGHIGAYVRAPSRVDTWLETRQMRGADHVFAYTATGGRLAEERGVPQERVSVVQNSVDTLAMRDHRAALTETDLARFRAEHDLTGHPVLAHIGALDASKRMGFLGNALDALWVADPAVRVVVAGSGDQAELLDAAVARGQVRRIGYADDRVKALIAGVATCLLNPGRVGLVAVDALALAIPVVTTDYAFHAPEAEYLEEGVSRFTAPDDPAGFVRWLLDHELLAGSPRAPEAWSPSLDEMVERFAAGVQTMLGADPRQDRRRPRSRAT